MRNFVFIFLSSLVFNIGFSQSYIVDYEEKANVENQLKNVTDENIRNRVRAHLSQPTYYKLYLSNDESLYVKKDENETKNNSSNLVEIGKKNGGTHKNHKMNQYRKEAEILGELYLIEDKLSKINWVLVDEEREIEQFKCKKAYTEINNERIEAWYSLDYQISDGPSDYYGLPGLIIELISFKKTYKVLSVKEINSKINIPLPFMGKRISKVEYENVLKEKLGAFGKL